MGKQGNGTNKGNGFKGKMTEQRFISYRTLLSTIMNEVKAIRGSKTKSGVVTLNFMDVDVPTMNLAVNIPEYEKYVKSMIQSYNRYLGYESGITFNNIKDVFKYSLDLYCMMEVIFRMYQSNEFKLPTGEEIRGIFDYCTTSVLSDNDTIINVSARIDNSLKGISNKVWESDYISRVEQILLPPQVLETYNYLLGQMFDVSDNSSKEQLTLMRIWPSLEDQSFITIPKTDGSFPTITATQFKSCYDNLNAVLTPKVRDFICTFLGWVKPNQDWTRPITADILYVTKDEKVISTFNNIYPEKVGCNVCVDGDISSLQMADVENFWTRYYYDFEILLSCETKSEVVATKYYFGIDNVNSEQMVMMQNELLNDIKVDFYNYLLLVILASEEISGSKAKYVGGIYSMLTKVDCVTGKYVEERKRINQIYVGNDLKLELYDYAYNLGTEDADQLLASSYAGLVGDALEVAEYSENLSIFNYPINVPEDWNVLWRYSQTDYIANFVCDVIVNGKFDKLYDPSLNDYTSAYNYIINHDNDDVACDTYVMDPNEVHLALATTIFSFLTGFDSYNESIQFIDNLFRGKQQETK